MKLESISPNVRAEHIKKNACFKKNLGVYDSSDPNRILKAHQPPNHTSTVMASKSCVVMSTRGLTTELETSSGDFQIESWSQPATGYLVESLNLTNPSEEKMFIKLEIFPNGGDK